MTDQRLRLLRNANLRFGRAQEAQVIEEVLSYRRAARKLRRAYGRYGPKSPGVITPEVCDVLAVGRGRR